MPLAIVTGANTGLGFETAVALASKGFEVLITSRSTLKGNAAVSRITDANPIAKVSMMELDLASMESINKFVSAYSANYGTWDVLVNNAGITRDGLLMRMKTDDWRQVLDLNLTGVFLCTRAVSRSMLKARHGRIINITGKSEPEHTNGAFCAKAGIHSWAKGLSRMVGKHGVTVNCVPPGRIHSEQIFRNYTPEYRQWQCDNEIPVGRYGEPEDMANLVTFLASPLASYITGAVIPVDGGLRKYQF